MSKNDRASSQPNGQAPGVPQSEPASFAEPTSPRPPLPPKPDQRTPADVSPTGCPFQIPLGGDGQQGEFQTTAQGTRVPTTDRSLKAGPRGPVLLQDHHLREKITHFDHERIPERVVHARGAGAHGVFRANGAASSLSRAQVFAEGEETEVFVRFSTVLGSRGSADTVRDTRGFATKFYTAEGVWDLVGNNIPVFFIQDGIKFPDVIHAGKPHPDREIPQAQSAHDTFWDFVTLHTEATHHTIWNMSDRGIPRSYRMMEGFGVNTFRFFNAAGESSLVKFHWKPRLGVHSLVWEEAQIAGGVDPDFHRRDLADAIEAGAFPEWDLGVQVFPDTEDQMFQGIDLLDPTKIVPEELVPVQIIGTMTLNANPTNFFEETEQVAFHPGHLPPGIDVTADPLLQGRLFSYLDTQISRLGGPNFSQLPINRPHAPVNDMFRDGMHQVGKHAGVAPYRPNSLDGGNPFIATEEQGARIDVPVPILETTITREQAVSFDDHYSQARLFYLSLSEVEQRHVTNAYTFELGKCYEQSIKERAVGVLAHIDQGLANTVADGLGLPHPEPQDTAEVTPSPALSQVGQKWPVQGRQLGILTTENSDPAAVAELVAAAFAADLVPLVIGESGGTLGESEVPISRTYTTARSVEFDAVVVADAPDLPEARVLLDEVFRHNKAAAVLSAAAAKAAELGLSTSGPGVVEIDTLAQAVEALDPLLATHRVWERELGA
ncbi:Catalase HPII [Corynebacterium occultum]|uniref:Catalase n=1 Tax=Corynebacterium occultum TaxID=2675219 RepID=A0A6B8W3A8_9CORY|nr:catalase [Corynebacterium occultum]QGU08004.1 Catalase HPII [Corynebacterium occultum]